MDRLPFATSNSILHSRADVWTGLQRELDRSTCDVLNLHWLGSGTMSIEEIGRLRHPVVMTLHDMWAFAGAEHYSFDRRFIEGYSRSSRGADESGVDWNRRTWRRKRRSWTSPRTIVTPSRWLADRVVESELMRSWPVAVVPNPIDVQFWSPLDRAAARASLGIPSDVRVILFGAVGGEKNRIKGAELLWAALGRLGSEAGDGLGDVVVATFGGKRSFVEPAGRLPFRTHHLGRIADDRLLRRVYSAADVMVIPSRLDNLPNTGVEAQACGLPVVGFRIGGLPEVVEDGETGLLVNEEDAAGMAESIRLILSSDALRRRLGGAAMRHAAERFDPAVIAAAYGEVFDAAREAASPVPP